MTTDTAAGGPLIWPIGTFSYTYFNFWEPEMNLGPILFLISVVCSDSRRVFGQMIEMLMFALSERFAESASLLIQSTHLFKMQRKCSAKCTVLPQTLNVFLRRTHNPSLRRFIAVGRTSLSTSHPPRRILPLSPQIKQVAGPMSNFFLRAR